MEEHKGRGNQGYDAKCKLCQEEIEDIVHFTMKCKKLEQKRDYTIIDKNIEDPGERMRVLLFRNKNYTMVSKMLRGLWDLRKNLLKLEGIENPHVQNTFTQGNEDSLGARNIHDIMYDRSPGTQKNIYPRVG